MGAFFAIFLGVFIFIVLFSFVDYMRKNSDKRLIEYLSSEELKKHFMSFIERELNSPERKAKSERTVIEYMANDEIFNISKKLDRILNVVEKIDKRLETYQRQDGVTTWETEPKSSEN